MTNITTFRTNFVKVTSASSCFSGLDWQFDRVHNFHSWSFMICHATVASLVQRASPWSCKCPKGHSRICHAYIDPLGWGQRHKPFLSLTSRRIFLINSSTRIPFQSGGLPCHYAAFFLFLYTCIRACMAYHVGVAGEDSKTSSSSVEMPPCMLLGL